MMLKLGLLGKKLSHSFSPQIHDLIMKKMNIEGKYGLYEVLDYQVADKIAWFNKMDFSGINVTIPYKREVMKHIDELSTEALKIGAVNTVLFYKGYSKGYNSDYYGFRITLEKFNINVNGKSIVILGTGGAAAAVFHCVKDLGASNIKLVSRNPWDISDDWNKNNIDIVSYKELDSLKGEVIINCTPCGMYPDCSRSPVDRNILSNYEYAMDLVYNPKETIFLNYAKSIGLKTCNGLYMLIGQAIAAQEIWNNVKIEKGIIGTIYNAL